MIDNNTLFPVDLSGDDGMTLNDLALYAAGQLDIYYQCVDRGEMTMQEISERMQISLPQLLANRSVWLVRGVLDRRDAMKDMLTAEAKR